ncbi:MAG: hypothetical protein CL878_06700 [Dehalococcoidia bacterium]|nr:hypothetical protein [Dehalococcoidia bacterium]
MKRWNGLRSAPPVGISIDIIPSQERILACKGRAAELLEDEISARPPGWTPKWCEALISEVAAVLARGELPGAGISAVEVPRFVHGQSQGICDVFGASVEAQPDGNFYVHPVDPGEVASRRLVRTPVTRSRYWGAVEWIRYARRAARGRVEFRNPVMTGPFDTANYLLGTTRLLEWTYSEPEILHWLLDEVTRTIIGMLGALREAAGGTLHGEDLFCVRNIYCLCSECRSLVSAEIFAEYEAPYLRRIGDAVGPYAIHSCGSWERTVRCSLLDSNLRAMNGQVRENDLHELCRHVGGRLVLSIGPSRDVHERYTWPDTKSFLEYVLQTVPPDQAVEIQVAETDVPLYEELCGRIRGKGAR